MVAQDLVLYTDGVKEVCNRKCTSERIAIWIEVAGNDYRFSAPHFLEKLVGEILQG